MNAAEKAVARALYTAIITVRPEYTPGVAAKMANGLAVELCARSDLFTITPVSS